MKLLSFGTSNVTSSVSKRQDAPKSQGTSPVNTHQLLTLQKDQLSLQRMGGVREVLTNILAHLTEPFIPTQPTPVTPVEDTTPTSQTPSHNFVSENLFLRALTKPFR